MPASSRRLSPLWLSGASLAYLLLPNLIFCLSWLSEPVGIPLALALCVVTLRAPPVRTALNTDISHYWIAIGIALIWTTLGGAGHFSYANPDWVVRDAVYGDLIRETWPLIYPTENGHIGLLRTAMAYYLPPALLTKWLGIQWADGLLYAWTALGVFLFALLFMEGLTRKRALAACLLLVLFSGMDALGWLWVNGFYWPNIPMHIEQWAWARFQYSSFSTLLFWVPNHALGAWLGTSLLLTNRNDHCAPNLALVLLALLPLWSPFAALGLLPFCIVMFYQRARSGLNWRPDLLIGIPYLTLGLIATYLLTLNASKIGGGSMADGSPSEALAHPALFGFFATVEFGLLSLCLWRQYRSDQWQFPWLAASIAVLFTLPWLPRIGPGNDLVMRTSIPALLILCWLCRDTLLASQTSTKWLKPSLITLLLIGAITPGQEIWRATTWKIWPANYERSLPDVLQGNLPPHYVAQIPPQRVRGLIKLP